MTPVPGMVPSRALDLTLTPGPPAPPGTRVGGGGGVAIDRIFLLPAPARFPEPAPGLEGVQSPSKCLAGWGHGST